MGKGDNRRPSQIPIKQYNKNWDKIFHPNKPEKPK